MKRGLFLNVVIRECTTIFQLLPSEDETLLVGGDAIIINELYDRLHKAAMTYPSLS